ncbi:UPF0182 family protein [Microbacterium sp. YY-01]|uniref:UPF0182 family membrane protein n=1 Tax=Microbacterium sp. YY-01 TaxID=3421634 RepID=UPI003D163136
MTTTPEPTQATPSTSRRILTITLVVIAAVIAAFFIFASLYTDYLWYDQLSFTEVLTTRWLATAVMFLVGFVAMAVPLFVSLQLSYRMRPVYVRLSSQLDRYQEVVEPLRRLGMWGMPIFFGLFAGFASAGSWQTVWLWFNSVPAGETDPQFGLDVGFYLFDMPFYSGLFAFVSAVLLLCLIVTAVVSYLYGSVRVGQGELRISKAARIQLAVIAGLYLLVQAGSLWLDRYATLFAPNGRMTGAGYTAVNAVIPGHTILAVIAAAVAVLFFITAIIGRWRYPLVATGLLIVASLVIGVGYPWAINTFQVKPNEQALEMEYIQRNVDLTRSAYGIAEVEKVPFEARTEAEAGQLRGDADTTASIRLMDPAIISPTVQQLQQYRGYYDFQEPLDVDRYEIDGKIQDAVVAVRELSLEDLDPSARTWVNNTLVYTHGYGMVVAKGNERTVEGEPVFIESEMPTAGVFTEGGYEPRIYFGEKSPQFSIVGAPEGATPMELDYPRGQEGENLTSTTFDGDGGPSVGSFFNRVLFALKFQSEQILFSDDLNPESQILYDRHPLVRVQKAAPYLTLDSDPYPSIVDGRIVWIIDGYTTSATFPYSTAVNFPRAISSGGSTAPTFPADDINYIRNSVKATVDAYDGSVTLYAWDDEDPLLQAWQNVYPTSLKPVSEMSGELMSHVRYPTDLFKVQRAVLGTYHVDKARTFYNRDNGWATPNDPTNDQMLQSPYYLSMQMPGQDEATFSMFTTFIPDSGSRNVLMGYLSVDSDAGTEKGKVSDDYGKMRLLEISADTTVPGPGQVQNSFNSDTQIAQEMNVLRIGASDVKLGNLLTLPVGGGLLYVQPVYVQSTGGTSYPLLRKVLVAFGDQLAFENTLSEALDTLFGGDSGAPTGDEDEVQPDDAEDTPDGGDTPAPPAVDPTAQMLLETAREAMAERDAALKAGDLTKFAAADKRLVEAIEKLLLLEEGDTATE